MKNEILKATRGKMCKTQAQIAKEIGIAEISYRKYEAGMSTKTIQTAIRIARALDTTVEALWGRVDTLKTE